MQDYLQPKNQGGTLLTYVPVPLYFKNDAKYIESQACNGLRLWADNFDKVIVMMPRMAGSPPAGWIDSENIGGNLSRIEIVSLPEAYRLDRFLYHLAPTAKLIREQILRADYLGFAIGGLFGDWGAVSCKIAHWLNRPHFVWTDRVESEVFRQAARKYSFSRRLRAALVFRMMASLERNVIRNAQLGLFHGKDTFSAYAPFSCNPQLVHDIHLSKSDQIPSADLICKIEDANTSPFSICYVGRAADMKGPFDWLSTLEVLHRRGVTFKAKWLGDGPDLERMREWVHSRGLNELIELEGFVANRSYVLRTLRESHIFMFCHKTPESPRNLIEALVCGCPIVGYQSSYADDLIGRHGGGVLTASSVHELSRAVEDLAVNRSKLADLIGKAAIDGRLFDQDAVFRHRSELIKRFLPAISVS